MRNRHVIKEDKALRKDGPIGSVAGLEPVGHGRMEHVHIHPRLRYLLEVSVTRWSIKNVGEGGLVVIDFSSNAGWRNVFFVYNVD